MMRAVTVLLAAALALPLAVPAHANIVVNIDKSTQRMTVTVDGATRYVWPVSTGRAGYDTPNGTFRPNRMDASHMSQEWDNAPMPHSIFFDKAGHAIHGFFDVKHLGLPVSHGCVRLSPDHASTLFALVKAEGMGDTTVVVSGRTPAGSGQYMARRAPDEESAAPPPMQIAPGYDDQAGLYDRQSPSYYRRPQPYYGQQQYGYGQEQPYYRQPQPYYGQQYGYRQDQSSYRQQPYYGEQGYQQQFVPYRPFNQY